MQRIDIIKKIEKMLILIDLRIYFYILISMSTDQLVLTMDNLYYKYIDIQAKKNKIDINIPIKKHMSNNEDTIDSESSQNSTIINDIKYSEEYMYRKPWNKLNAIHKIIKIKEFISNLQFDDNEMKNNIKDKLVLMIKDKKLTKKTDINYDSINGIILSIPVLQYNNNKYIIV